MTPAQCRAARALIGLSQEDVAMAAGVGIQTLIAFENGKRQPYARTLFAIQAALEQAGVVFVPENGEGVGVRLQKGK